MSSGVFFVFLWAGLTFFLLPKIYVTPVSWLFGIATVLIYSHVLYGGYFLFKKEERINFTVIILVIAIYSCLILLTLSLGWPALWFFRLQMAFLCAASFHAYYKTRLSQDYLKEFCNYKLYVEISSIIFCLWGLLILWLLPSLAAALGVFNLLFIIKSNHSIFFKKKLYRMNYAPCRISDSPLVSIVIIAYNEERYIGRLLESIKRQDYRKFEVIVVDDHSTDNTVGIAGDFARDLPLKVVQKEVRGISRSRNYGAGLAQGELILFLDADVHIGEDFIGKNLKTFRGKRLAAAGIDFIAETDFWADKIIAGFYRLWLRCVQYFNPRGIGIGLMVARELHRKVLFDETVIMSEDFDYVRRSAQLGKFRIIGSMPLRVSWRRFEKENRFLLILKYLYFEWYRQNIGEIRKKMLPYEFGDNNSTCFTPR